MAILWRHSVLGPRHEAIGAELEDWNGMGTAWFYDHTPERAKADYEAIRTKAGLMDVSGLKKAHVVGKDAAYVIDRVTTRNVEKIAPGRSTYASILNAEGKFIDDCIIYHLAVNTWMVVIGTGIVAMETAVADYDGDGVTDAATYHSDTGAWHILESTTGLIRTDFIRDDRQTPFTGGRPVPGQYDDDHLADLALVIRGRWVLKSSKGSSRNRIQALS